MRCSRLPFCLAFSIFWLGALTAQAQNQQPASGSMDGMDMSKPADMGQSSDANKPMDMSHGMMDMGKGSGSMNMGGMQRMHGAMDHHAPLPVPPGVLRVVYDLQSADWTPAKLAALPHVTVTLHNDHTKTDDAYSGVPVIALLTPLGVSDKPHGGNLRLVVVAVGSDGYEAAYAIGELIPELSSSTVIVADAINGKPLTTDGPLKIVGSGDKKAARHVRNLVALKVLPAQ